MTTINTFSDTTLDDMRKVASEKGFTSIAAKLKTGEYVILVTERSENPEKDIISAMLSLFGDKKR